MTTKTITIMDDAYRLLLHHKLGKESFSDVIRRKFSQKRNIMQFAGAWKNVPDTDIEEMKRNILELRKRSTKELTRTHKK